MLLHIHAAQVVVVQGGDDAGQQDAKALPVRVVLPVGDRFRLGKGLDPRHCLIQRFAQALLLLRIEGELLLAVLLIHLQRLQRRGEDAHILAEPLLHQQVRRHSCGFGGPFADELLHQLLTCGHLRQAVRPQHLAQDLHLAPVVFGGLFFGRSGGVRLRVLPLELFGQFFAFFGHLLQRGGGLFPGTQRPVSDLIQIDHSPIPPCPRSFIFSQSGS